MCSAQRCCYRCGLLFVNRLLFFHLHFGLPGLFGAWCASISLCKSVPSECKECRHVLIRCVCTVFLFSDKALMKSTEKTCQTEKDGTDMETDEQLDKTKRMNKGGVVCPCLPCLLFFIFKSSLKRQKTFLPDVCY